MLTDTQVRQARPKDKFYSLTDGRGLSLMVRPTGAKWWRLRYRIQRKHQTIRLGVYPDVSLSMARDRRDDARRLLADGKNPSAERQAEKRALIVKHQGTFEKVARHYLAALLRKVRKGKGSIKTYTRDDRLSKERLHPVLRWSLRGRGRTWRERPSRASRSSDRVSGSPRPATDRARHSDARDKWLRAVPICIHAVAAPQHPIERRNDEKR